MSAKEWEGEDIGIGRKFIRSESNGTSHLGVSLSRNSTCKYDFFFTLLLFISQAI